MQTAVKRLQYSHRVGFRRLKIGEMWCCVSKQTENSRYRGTSRRPPGLLISFAMAAGSIQFLERPSDSWVANCDIHSGLPSANINFETFKELVAIKLIG